MAPSIHFVTVHVKPRWVKIQRDFLDRFVGDYKISSLMLESIKDDRGFHILNKQKTIHPYKNGHILTLADEVAENSQEEFLCFLDSDAFPISENFNDFIKEKMEIYPMIAVVRYDFGELLPHPCFACIRRETYKNYIHPLVHKTWILNWHYRIAHFLIKVDRNTFLPLVRSNRHNIDHCFFGIYGDLIYHHGGGSRRKVSSKMVDEGTVEKEHELEKISDKLIKQMSVDPYFFRQFM